LPQSIISQPSALELLVLVDAATAKKADYDSIRAIQDNQNLGFSSLTCALLLPEDQKKWSSLLPLAFSMVPDLFSMTFLLKGSDGNAAAGSIDKFL
jgi:hypothetical protein